MIYPQNFEQKIGFDQIRQLLKDRCLSTLGEERVSDMVFSDQYEEVEEKLKGITCGFKSTSCGDQLAQACLAALEAQKKES